MGDRNGSLLVDQFLADSADPVRVQKYILFLQSRCRAAPSFVSRRCFITSALRMHALSSTSKVISVLPREDHSPSAIAE